ncbi:uncharacterized protein M6B38_187310 [Iris pallida]|uniref:CCHC-type domain-containing protein n=1 Tax=Iris pallida TaxID=29817 RepID=A0AAX6EK07_IRIPA|nr:uncharacterized protein M6B38_187310 [Iris pallida]
MPIVDKFVVRGIVSKLPAGWSNFYTRMHRKKLDISLEDLLQEIHVEDEIRSQQKMDFLSNQLAKANLVQTREFKGKQVASHHKKDSTNLKVKGPSFKQQKSKSHVTCFNCGKKGHYKSE